MITILNNSNILNVTDGIICHQTNCLGIMGGGLALQIKNKWPKVFNEYNKICATINPKSELLGEVNAVAVDSSLVIANCFGQENIGYGKCMTSYEAWDKILPKLVNISDFYSLEDLHMPWMIGCGLAGGDWNIMFKKLNDYFGDSAFNLYIHEYIA